MPFLLEDYTLKWFTELNGPNKAAGLGQILLVLQDLTLAHTNTEYDCCTGLGVLKWHQDGAC